MLRATLWHEPAYFAFHVRDRSHREVLGSTVASELQERKIAAREGVVAVSVKSEYTEVPITVEFDRDAPNRIRPESWDRIVECPLRVRGTAISFESCVGDEFGRLEVPSDHYRLRVCYGGQGVVHPDGETEDFYLVQIWPSNDTTIVVLKVPACEEAAKAVPGSLASR